MNEKDSTVESNNQENEPSDESHQQGESVVWDGSEAQLVSESEKEKYSESNTGVKIKYTLSGSEIYEFFKHTRGYQKNKILQKKHTIIEIFILLLLVITWFFTKNVYYLYLMALPVLASLVIWSIPLITRKKLSDKFCCGEEISAEIFPDKIVLQGKSGTREVLFDGTCECEETAGMILVYPRRSQTVMIPIRAIEPELIPDVQAMIFAGSKPRYEG